MIPIAPQQREVNERLECLREQKRELEAKRGRIQDDIECVEEEMEHEAGTRRQADDRR